MPAKGNAFLKKAFFETEYTLEKIRELNHCSKDPIYFIKNYIKIQHPVRGSIPFELYDFQEEIINCIHNNKDSLILTARQCGKTSTIGMYLLWYASFHEDKTILIASKDNSHAIDIQDRIKYAYEELPDWLKPGIVWYNRHSMKFDNGSQIISSATTEKTGRGYSISCVTGDTLITVRNKQTKQIITLPISSFIKKAKSSINNMEEDNKMLL